MLGLKGLMMFWLQISSQLPKFHVNSTYRRDLSSGRGPHQGQRTQPACAFHALQPSLNFPKKEIKLICYHNYVIH